MTEQQKHLESAVQQLNNLADEINRINGTLNVKREQATKLRGIIEYLNGIGVTLPKDDSPEEVKNPEIVGNVES